MAPNYKDTGLHSEVVEIDYDSEIISYEVLIDIFFAAHNETLRPYDQRVKSIIFYRSEAERILAQGKLEEIREMTDVKETVYTEVKPLEVFYLAEPEHQNRSLKLETSLYGELEEIFKTDAQMMRSILASKLNGYIYGYGTMEGARAVLEQSGLSEASRNRVIEVIENRPYILE